MTGDIERKAKAAPEQQVLFELPPVEKTNPQLKQLSHPIWTENKARFIAKYIYLFEMITKHGTYIDGFAGPQRPDHPEMWAAKLVLDIEPKWLRHFYLFEKNRAGYRHLKLLRDRYSSSREIEVNRGDFNVEVGRLLSEGTISQKEATFCLLDQRTFECHWKTVCKLANYKQTGNNKFELFYFLAAWWYRRAVTAVTRKSVLQNWWGRDDWARLRDMKLQEVKEEFVSRFQIELGYRWVHAWPILDQNGRDMYYMIHCADYEESPSLMRRAYDEAVQPVELPLQLSFATDS